MQIVADVVVVLVGLLVIVKCGACIGSIYLLAARSKNLSKALEEGAPQGEVDALYLPLRPLDCFVTHHLDDHPRGSVLAKKVIRGPVVVSLGGLTTFLFAKIDGSAGVLLLVLGASTALCAGLHVFLAFEEGLVFGRKTRRLFHVRPSGTGSLAFVKDWSVTRDGNNLILYFLALLYMLSVGVAAFIFGFDTVYSKGFSVSGPVSLATAAAGVFLAVLPAIFNASETPVDGD